MVLKLFENYSIIQFAKDNNNANRTMQNAMNDIQLVGIHITSLDEQL